MSYEVPSNILHLSDFLHLFTICSFQGTIEIKILFEFFIPKWALLLILLSYAHSGDGEIRTLDPLLARQVLSQLSYAPIYNKQQYLIMGLSGLEPPTSRLSGVRSNQLSYKPIDWQPPTLPCRLQHSTIGRLGLNHRVRDGNGCYPQAHRHQNFMLLSFHYFQRMISLE